MQEKSLYCPSCEHDSCGIGFIAQIKGIKSHQIVDDAISMLENMEHRGGIGSDPNSGDGAGILIQMPDGFFRVKCKEIGLELPEYEKYGVGMVFFPGDLKKREECRRNLNIHIEEIGFELLGYRTVPYNKSGIGLAAKENRPYIEQVFVQFKKEIAPESLERKLFVLRTYSTNFMNKYVLNYSGEFYFTSFSYRTIVYKGQFRTHQLKPFFPDLHDSLIETAIAMVHSRFSTNTFPKWKLAQPFRYLAHNGEINTIWGNVNWMRSNETLFESTLFENDEIQKLSPILDNKNSDSANLDLMLEILIMGGRSLPHALMMLIPEAWMHNHKMSDEKKAFYEYHASIMEPWDGPATVCFTDGKIVGATLDRNGLRPARYVITNDDRIILSSEAGALSIPEEIILKKGRVQPGKMFYADLEEKRILFDKEIKSKIAVRKPYREWLNKNEVKLSDFPEKELSYKYNPNSLLQRQQLFGFSQEDLNFTLYEMAVYGHEPIGSMGTDIPLAVLSNNSRHLSDYFKQQFAQVSNPPIDPIRERNIMSLNTSVGRLFNILSETPQHCKQIVMNQPILKNEELEKIRNIAETNFRAKTINILFEVNNGAGALEKAIDMICSEANSAIIDENYNILLLSDRNISKDLAPIPSLLAVGAIHQHLIENGLRVRIGIVVEAGDIRETHHVASLIAYGANALNPYMVFDSINSFKRNKLTPSDISNEKAYDNYIKSIGKGLLKVFSKMGISTLQSYHGAQIFEAIGISTKVIKKCFTGTISRIEGIDFDGIAREVEVRHRLAYPLKDGQIPRLEEGGLYKWRQKGEAHLFNPKTITLLQNAARNNDYNAYKEYAKEINEQDKEAITLRSLLDFRKADSIPLEEVEPEENILKRFATGAMSYGSISHEAHTTLAIAMNRIGGKSNSGEGGEDPNRYKLKPNGDSERSAIKQIASGRFGVSSYYLTNADELQIKMAQGAKPGEGGQLPGHKVDKWIGAVRNSIPGVELISPPPHHDIYSIEDLAQLIYDLKNANRKARINVKLVSKAGVGTIAAGVAKARADAILISGHDGGTGAAPMSSIHHTGSPWELGLAEAHQTLVKNKLRDRVVLQTDGQIRTGRDLAIATLLGAEEWGIATAALIASGCIMMRKCHTNTCPVGVATQNPELRKLFTGKPEHVINMFRFLANDLREIMAMLGFRTVNEMVGQVERLKIREGIKHWKLNSIDLSPILYKDNTQTGLYKQKEQEHHIEQFFDWKILEKAKPAIENQQKVSIELPVKNTDRAIGTMLSNEISKRYEDKGLPDDTIKVKLRGSAGQSFAAFGAAGIIFELEGEANDYLGKGLSGSRIIVYPDRKSGLAAEENVIIGNVAFYGAIKGEAFINGKAGERFCVRNSGANIVVEGIGRHGCEYMTGGTVIILGDVGTNFGAGMSGGVAYIFDPQKQFEKYKNTELTDYYPIDFDDEDILLNFIKQHADKTGSNIAKQILANWDQMLDHFIKVFPREYQNALSALKY